ncbi:hypothetical protein J4212_01330 [Candidatus Woesearchaeota archaeon]|nr:hypothetical protein [Candidatus Woesearchaeota archaeon]
MVEKKFVVYGLRLSYNGPVGIEEFYKEVEDWIRAKGMQKELKKKSERLIPKGKNIEWAIEIWRRPMENVKGMVRLRAIFHNVREIELQRRGKTIRTQHADALFIIDGILETHLWRKWEMNPWFFFVRAMVDKYIWPFHSEKYDGPVAADTHELHKHIQAFLNIQKKKYM